MLKIKTAIVLTSLTVLMALFFGACSPSAPSATTQTAPLAISTSSLDNGQIGIIYSRTLKATGGSRNYSWSISDGSLPAGLHMDAKTGIISGLPNTPGTASFTVQVSDGTATSTRSLSITINSISVPLAIGTSNLSPGEIGIAYSRTLTASGGSGKYSWAAINGALPEGLMLDSDNGVISGTPRTAGTFTFSIQVKDDQGSTRDQPLSITIFTMPTIVTSSLGNGEAGISWGKQLQADGGTGTYSWSLVKGALPDGINMDSSNSAIWGTPAATGTFNFTLKVSDGLGSATRDFTMTIVPTLKPIIIGTTSLPDGKIGTAYSQAIKASGGSESYVWQVVNGSLPDGLTLDSKTGVISGTPKTAGVLNFTVQAYDEYGASDSQNLSITVK